METELPRYLGPAMDAVEEERREWSQECEAFAAFREKVADLAVEAPTEGQAAANPDDSPGGLRIKAAGRGASTEAILRAYRDTVTALSHYSSSYDESPAEHLAAELGDDVASSLAANDRLTPVLRRATVSAIEQPIATRKKILVGLEREAEAINNGTELIESVTEELDEWFDNPVRNWLTGDLFCKHDRLDMLDNRCGRLIADRQEQIDAFPVAIDQGGREAPMGYLYRDLDVTYPVIADITRLCEQIDDRREAIESEIARR